MKWDFEGKTVVITGAAQGIGYQVAKGVVEGGGHAVILNLNEEKAKKAAEQLGNADAYKIDCGNPQNIRAVMVQVLKDHPKDFASNRGLMMMVGHRKNLLTYLRRTDINRYRDLVKKLGLRK